MTVRPAVPDFAVSLNAPTDFHRGSGREFAVRATREDGFDGPIEVHIDNVPSGYHITSPLLIEAGHHVARGCRI